MTTLRICYYNYYVMLMIILLIYVTVRHAVTIILGYISFPFYNFFFTLKNTFHWWQSGLVGKAYYTITQHGCCHVFGSIQLCPITEEDKSLTVITIYYQATAYMRYINDTISSIVGLAISCNSWLVSWLVVWLKSYHQVQA